MFYERKKEISAAIFQVDFAIRQENEFKVQLVWYALSSEKLTLICVGHVIVGGTSAVSVFQGLSASLTKTRQT